MHHCHFPTLAASAAAERCAVACQIQFQFFVLHPESCLVKRNDTARWNDLSISIKLGCMIGHWWIYDWTTFPVKKLYSEFWWWCSSLCPRYQDFSLLPLVTRSAGSDCCSIGPGIRKLLILLKTSPKSHESVNPKLRRLSYCDSPFLMGFVSEKKSQWWLPVSTWYPGLNDLCWSDPIPPFVWYPAGSWTLPGLPAILQLHDK